MFRARKRGWIVLSVLAGLLALPAVARGSEHPMADVVKADLAFAGRQLERTLAKHPDTDDYPWYVKDGSWVTSGVTQWFSGFLPGQLWSMFEATGDPLWQQRAEARQAAIAGQKSVSNSDLGFMFVNSYVAGYRLTNKESFRSIALTAAATLAGRFNETVGSIEARFPPKVASDDFNVTIDVMPNLELLFWGAAQPDGDPRWRDMAVRHAQNTLRDHVRGADKDEGSFQVVTYDRDNGEVRSKSTRQGLGTDTTWSRGQAWGVYGFTMAFRETGNVEFLNAARVMARYFMGNLPGDGVPNWDFDDDSANAPRDTSAAAIVASALVELSERDSDAGMRAQHLADAEKLIGALSKPPFLAEGTTSPSILRLGTINKNSNSGVNTGLVWGDHYFVEALVRYQLLTGAPPPPTSTPTTTPPTTAACAATGNATLSAPGEVGGSGTFGTTGDCTKVTGSGGADRITIAAHAGTTRVVAGSGDDRICAQNSSTDVVKGGDGRDQALVDGGDSLESATSTTSLDCAGTGPGTTTTTSTTSTTTPPTTAACAATGNATLSAPGEVRGSGTFGSTGDCTKVTGSGGADRITIAAHAGTTRVVAGSGDDRICAQNSSTDVVKGGDGRDQALVDGGDSLESATSTTGLICTS